MLYIINVSTPSGMLIGSANEFQEYVHGYYGTVSEFTSTDMRQIGQENAVTKNNIDMELRQFKSLSNPIHVCLTNATSTVVYNMVCHRWQIYEV